MQIFVCNNGGMTSAQRTNLQAQLRAYRADVRNLERAMVSLATQEFVTVSLSAGGGSKSFSRATASAIPALIAYFNGKIAAINRALQNAAPGGIRTIRIVRC